MTAANDGREALERVLNRMSLVVHNDWCEDVGPARAYVAALVDRCESAEENERSLAERHRWQDTEIRKHLATNAALQREVEECKALLMDASFIAFDDTRIAAGVQAAISWGQGLMQRLHRADREIEELRAAARELIAELEGEEGWDDSDFPAFDRLRALARAGGKETT